MDNQSLERCKVCCMPPTRPDTPFEGGICKACLNFEFRRHIDWAARKEQLLALLEEHDWECCVASSGGKDSHHIVKVLSDLGCRRITCITAETCDLTDVGAYNIRNLARYVDQTIRLVPNVEVRKKLNRLGLETVGDISWPEHAGIFSAPVRAAWMLGEHLLFYGESPQMEYGGPDGSEVQMGMTSKWASEFGGFLGLRPSDLELEVGREAMVAYTLPPPHVFDELVSVQFLGQYLPWDSVANGLRAVNMGLRTQFPVCLANLWDHENLDNYQTGIHDWFMFLKYGYGRGCMQAAISVRHGHWSREAALHWVELHDGRFPSYYMGEHFKYTLQRIGVTPPQLLEIAKRFNAQGDQVLSGLERYS